MISQDKYNELIAPWQVFYSEEWQRNFFYNPETEESLWVLPEEVSKKVAEHYQEEVEEALQEHNNVIKYIPPEQRMSRDNETVMKRPARKQVEVSLSKQFAYKQGDEDYNIWYDKYSSTTKDKDKEPAMTRCDPDKDAGFTKADKMEKFSSYFCIHFARGCCAEGSNCRYYHRIPSLDECYDIDQSKDIFGRTRYADHRSDREGIGTFLKDCRTLYVTDFKMPTGLDPVAQMYEVLWRHFSPFGDIEDINIIPGRGMAFLKFAHRCMAEFVKVAMVNQALDQNEILTIKWAREEEEDPAPKKKEIMKRADELKKNGKREREPQQYNKVEKYESGYGQDERKEEGYEADAVVKKVKNDDVDNAINMMSQVLKKIENRNKGGNEDDDNQNEEVFDANGNLRTDLKPNKKEEQPVQYDGYGYVNPENNDMPLFKKK